MAVSKIQQVTNNSGSNYCKMPDGTLIQWGEITVPVNQNVVTLSFPTAFASTAYGISGIGVFANARNVPFVYASQTTTTINIYRGSTDNTYAQAFRWIAIGRWK